jgi:hypothetical protein
MNHRLKALAHNVVIKCHMQLQFQNKQIKSIELATLCRSKSLARPPHVISSVSFIKFQVLFTHITILSKCTPHENWWTICLVFFLTFTELGFKLLLEPNRHSHLLRELVNHLLPTCYTLTITISLKIGCLKDTLHYVYNSGKRKVKTKSLKTQQSNTSQNRNIDSS